MGHRVQLEKLEVEAQDSTLTIDLQYRITATGEVRRMRFAREAA